MSETILVVDDEEDVVEVLRIRLLKQGYQVEVASNGFEGLEFVRHHPVDLIILDIMMPVMDGTEMASRLRDDPATAHIPIIFLSAIMERRDGGSDGRHATVTFAKPFNAAELLAKVDEMLRQASMAEVPLASSRQSRTG